MIIDNKSLQDPEEKASALNDFFVDQSRQSVLNAPAVVPEIQISTLPGPNLSNISTTPAEVESLLHKLDIRKSPGRDGLSTRVFKEGAAELAPSLAALFNASFTEGILPQDWKDATITPLYKKGSPSSPGNYRPISLLSVVSKVCERIVHTRLYKHLSPYFPPDQSGFRQEDGTELQLARLVHEISAKRDGGQHVLACFFDLSKAFDRVWHQGVLAKLHHCGVSGKVLAWLQAYLTGRRQRVQVFLFFIFIFYLFIFYTRHIPYNKDGDKDKQRGVGVSK